MGGYLSSDPYIGPEPNWRTKEDLGSGKCGRVYMCSLLHSRKQVAVKVLKPELTVRYSKKYWTGEKSMNLSHLNVVRIYGTIETGDQDFPEGILMEYGNLGSLEKSSTRNPLTDYDKLQVCLDISKGLQYLHSKNIVHRDIKPSNVVLMGELGSKPKFVAKITDFGFARIWDKQMTRMIGTPVYMAPEVARNGSNYDKSVDIYSLVKTLYVVYFNQPLVFKSHSSATDAVSENETPEFPCHGDPKIKSLLERGMLEKISLRPKLDEIIDVLQSAIENHPDKPKVQRLTDKRTNKTWIGHLQDVKRDLFVKPLENQLQWKGDEDNSSEGRLDLLKKLSNTILPQIHAAMEVVPWHCFMNEAEAQACSSTEKSNVGMEMKVGPSNDEVAIFVEHLGATLSMLKIDIGHDVLLFGACGYPEALVSQIVGPMGSVTVLSTNCQKMETLSAKMMEMEADPDKKHVIAYHCVDDYIEGAKEMFGNAQQFDAILTPKLPKFPEPLVCLLKDQKSLLTCVDGAVFIHVAGSERLSEPPERIHIGKLPETYFLTPEIPSPMCSRRGSCHSEVLPPPQQEREALSMDEDEPLPGDEEEGSRHVHQKISYFESLDSSPKRMAKTTHRRRGRKGSMVGATRKRCTSEP